MKTEEQAKAETAVKVSVPCMANETVMRVRKEYLKQFGIMETMSMKLKAPFRFGELSGKYLSSECDEALAHMWNILQVIRNIYFVQQFSKKKKSDLLQALEDHIIIQRAKLWQACTIYGNYPNIDIAMDQGSLFDGKVITMIKEVDAIIGPHAMGVKQSKMTHRRWWSLFLNHFEGLINFRNMHLVLKEFTPNCFEENDYPRLKEQYEKYKDHPQFKTSWLVMVGSKKNRGLPTDVRIPVPPNSSCCVCKEIITAPYAEIFNVSVYESSWIQDMKTNIPMAAVITHRVQADGGRSMFCSAVQNPRCVEFLSDDMQWNDEKGVELSGLSSVAKYCDNCLMYSSRSHRCADCKSAQYCSRECLLEDWEKYHKSACGEMKKKKDKKMPSSKKQKDDNSERWELGKMRSELRRELPRNSK